MSIDHDYGPLRTYEITWKSGHVERVQGHQVVLPPPTLDLFGIDVRTRGMDRIVIHGSFDGHWRLVLAADADDISAVRDVTGGECLPGIGCDAKGTGDD